MEMMKMDQALWIAVIFRKADMRHQQLCNDGNPVTTADSTSILTVHML